MNDRSSACARRGIPGRETRDTLVTRPASTSHDTASLYSRPRPPALTLEYANLLMPDSRETCVGTDRQTSRMRSESAGAATCFEKSNS